MKSQWKLDNPKASDPVDKVNTITLFGQTVPKPTNSAMQNELANVQHIANNRSIVKIGGEQFKYNKETDSYRQEYAIVGDKRVKLDPADMIDISKVDMIQMASTIYGNVSGDFFDMYDHDGKTPTPNTSKYIQSQNYNTSYNSNKK